jgi:hypothetical protein
MRTSILAALAIAAATAAAGRAAAAPAFGDAQDGLAIGIEITDVRRPTVAIVIENVTDHPIALRSYIATHEKQYDLYTIDVAWPLAKLAWDHARMLRGRGTRHPQIKVCGGRGARAITLTDDRDKSAPVTVTLGAGKQLRHEIDLGDWASRRVNGARALGGGWYELGVTYHVAGEQGVWNGTIASAKVALVRTGARAADMCDTGWPPPPATH